MDAHSHQRMQVQCPACRQRIKRLTIEALNSAMLTHARNCFALRRQIREEQIGPPGGVREDGVVAHSGVEPPASLTAQAGE